MVAFASKTRRQADSQRPLGADSVMVWQNLNLFPWRSVIDNVAFGLEMRGVSRAERYQRANALIASVGLRGFERHLPGQLSGGMRQRVALARALIMERPILLMDEPFAALDAQTKIVMQEELLKIFDQTHKTVLFVTHAIEEAILLGDEVVVMTARPGRIKEVIPIDLPRPRSLEMINSKEFGALFDRTFHLIREEVTAAMAQQAAMVSGAIMNRSARRSDEACRKRASVAERDHFSRGLGAAGALARHRADLSAGAHARSRSILWRMIADGTMEYHLGVTLLRIFAGFLVAAVTGIALGLLMGMSRIVSRVADIWIAALYPLPKISLIPLLIIWLGTGEAYRIVISAVTAFFPIVISTYSGIRQADRGLIKAAEDLGANTRQIQFKVVIPAAMPSILSGLQLGMGVTIILIVAAEMIGGSSQSGMGYLLISAGQVMETEKVFASLVVLAVMGAAIIKLQQWADRKIAPWIAHDNR